LPWLLLVLSAASFGYGVTTIRGAPASQWGLLAVASPLYGLSFLLGAAGFAVAVRQKRIAVAVVGVLLMMVVGRLPSAIATDMPMYAWTYKHLGVVDYIRHTHSLARDVDPYNGWPGFFALTAWFCDLTRISPITIAHWWTPAFYPLLTLMVYGMGRAWRLPPLSAVTVAFIVTAYSWVWQDYFGPQSAALLGVAGLLILVGLSRHQAVGVWLIIIIFSALTVTHQLTPCWALVVIALLAFSGKMKPWWIVLPLAAILLAFFLLYNRNLVQDYGSFSFHFTHNLKGNIPTVGVPGQRLVKILVRVLAIGLWLGAAIVLLVRWRKKQSFWALGVLAFSPMLLPLAESYGNEIVLRVFLYSLFGCAIALAPVFVRVLQAPARWQYISGLVAVLVGTAASAQGYTGCWYANVMPKVQVETSWIVLNQAELPAYLTAVAPVWPERSSWRYVDYARFNRSYDAVAILEKDLAFRHFNTEDDYKAVQKALYSRPDASTYLVMTDQMRYYSWYYGILPWDAFPNLKALLYRDTETWEPFYDGQGITVFVHKVNTAELAK
jgi:hypothetical protein